MDLYTDLLWLPRAPENFGQRCKELTQTDYGSEAVGNKIRALASYALDENQLNRLANVIRRLSEQGKSLKPLVPFRLGLLSNSTVDFFVPAFVATAARHGVHLDCIKADYNQVLQEALSPASTINSAKPDAVLIALDYRALPLTCKLNSERAATEVIQSALNYLASIRQGVEANSTAVCIFQTIAPPAESLFGSMDRMVPGSLRYLIERINLGLGEQLRGTASLMFDVEGLAETVGLAHWHSPAQWNLAKLPFSSHLLPLYADHLARIVASSRGKSRKCLVLDLDNTVWGGVIGDDGLEGIQLAQGDAAGEAFLAVQRLALQLRERGIVLAVSSKNNDEIARQPFQKHPEMLLKEDHFAVFQANWNDKATNIKAIAEELSLGTESMVLLDDNPVERGLVREILPEVGVPELPVDPAMYARILAAAGYFEATSFAKEDLERAGFYQDNARRVSLQKAAGDLEAYLVSLNMEITFQPFDATGRARIAQLINKSNQFNLTTRRYTEAEVAAVEKDSTCFTMQVRLADTFGDNGMISVIICREAGSSAWEIDTWLMSCRVLGRRVQEMVLLEVVKHARERGIKRLIGVYKPTEKNKLVVDHYGSLGFSLASANEHGTTVWELEVNGPLPSVPPMRVKSLGFATPVEA